MEGTKREEKGRKEREMVEKEGKERKSKSIA